MSDVDFALWALGFAAILLAIGFRPRNTRGFTIAELHRMDFRDKLNELNVWKDAERAVGENRSGDRSPRPK